MSERLQPDLISIPGARPTLLPMRLQMFRRPSLVVILPFPERPPAPLPWHHLAQLIELMTMPNFARQHPDEIDRDSLR